jgi:tetratricopeptide (TPR) repeat protein
LIFDPGSAYGRCVGSRGTRERLLATIVAAREREHELLTLCDDAPAPEPGLWTVKDHLAHLTAWRTYAAQMLDAVRTGAALPPAADSEDERNAEIYAANLDKSADEIKSAARFSYDDLQAAVAASSEEGLATPHPRYPNAALWQVVPGNCHYHLGQHLMFWHLEQGNEEAAEAAQQWVYDLDRSEFTEPKAVGAALYNFACFYSRVGRNDEALHRLGQAFELDPALKKVAQTDPDLDRMRHDPGLVALIEA